MHRIELSVKADKDLDSIESYTVANFGLNQTIVYQTEIYEALATIQRHPYIGYKISIGKDLMLCFQVNHHRIFYRFDGTTIFVIRLLHEKQIPSLHLDGKLE